MAGNPWGRGAFSSYVTLFTAQRNSTRLAQKPKGCRASCRWCRIKERRDRGRNLGLVESRPRETARRCSVCESNTGALGKDVRGGVAGYLSQRALAISFGQDGVGEYGCSGGYVA
eukprot:1189376-Prorocentrum_minimum.AAC.1